MGRPIPFSYGYPNPVASSVGGVLYVFHHALGVIEPTGESEPLTGYNVLPTSSSRRFHLWLLRGHANIRRYPPLLSRLHSATKFPGPVGVVEPPERRSSASLTLALMALSSAVSTDPPRPRICWRRVCRSTSWCTACRAGFGHVTWYVIVRAPLALARGDCIFNESKCATAVYIA